MGVKFLLVVLLLLLVLSGCQADSSKKKILSPSDKSKVSKESQGKFSAKNDEKLVNIIMPTLDILSQMREIAQSVLDGKTSYSLARSLADGAQEFLYDMRSKLIRMPLNKKVTYLQVLAVLEKSLKDLEEFDAVLEEKNQSQLLVIKKAFAENFERLQELKGQLKQK